MSITLMGLPVSLGTPRVGHPLGGKARSRNRKQQPSGNRHDMESRCHFRSLTFVKGKFVLQMTFRISPAFRLWPGVR